MKKLILAVLLIVTSTSAMAEWKLINYSDEISLYVDSTSIRKDGTKAKMWYLQDFKTPQKDMGKPYLSKIIKSVNDCKNETDKTLAIVFYQGNMQQGKITLQLDYADGESIERAIVPGSIGEILWKIACG